MDILDNRQGLLWDEVLEGAVESLRKTKGLLARSVNWERMQFVGSSIVQILRTWRLGEAV